MKISVEKLLVRLSGSRLLLKLLSWINKIPFPYQKIPIQFHDGKMAAHTFDRLIALLLWRLGLLESYEHTLIETICRPGMKVIDIGANIGFHTLQLSRSVGPEGSVWAFEPDPKNFRTLQQNLVQNDCPNVKAEQAAISNRTGQITLYHSSIHQGDHRVYDSGGEYQQAIPIRAVALDDYYPPAQKINFIKMDIQGAEGLALSGMHGLLTANPDIVILMEFFPAGIRKTGLLPERILEGLGVEGFKIFALGKKESRITEVTDFNQFVRFIYQEDYCNLLVLRDYHLLDIL